MRVATFYGVILASLAVAVGCGDPTSNATFASVGGTAVSGGASNVVISPSGGAALGVGGGEGVGGVPAIATTVPAAGAGGSGGQVATLAKGGAQAAGGSNAIGGTSAVGGSKATGGTSAVGGTTAKGGTSSTGGTTAKGGTSATGTITGASPCPTDGSACKIMPFGDSNTDGSLSVAGAYRLNFFSLAATAGKNFTFVGVGNNGYIANVNGKSFPPNHEGYNGFTIDNCNTTSGGNRSGIAPLVASKMSTYTPNIVLLMIGTNDMYSGCDVANAPARLGALVDSIYAKEPAALVVVAQIIPTTDATANGLIATYNAAIPALVQTRANAGKAIRYVNMYDLFVSSGAVNTSLLNDTWHPTRAGYDLIGAAFYNKIADVLK